MTISNTFVPNLMIETAGIVICITAQIALRFGVFRNQITKQYMTEAFLDMLMYNLCLLLLELSQAGIIHPWRTAVALLGFGTYLFPQVCAFLVSLFVARMVSQEEERFLYRSMLLYFLLFFQLAVTMVLQILNDLLVVDEFGKFSYGPANWTGFIFVSTFMLTDLFFLIRYSENLTRMERNGFAAYLTIPLVTILIRPFFPGIYMVALASCVSMLIMLGIILFGQSETIRKQEMDNEQLKIDIMLSQIQPHFMFNVLYVIQEICLLDAELASKAISDFSRFLRHNMDSISINKPIPFQLELDHVNHYVSLQKLRFGDALQVEYDLKCTDFKIPTLTLQPLVENAIRYGVRKKRDGRGTVRIRTMEYSRYYKIHVIDDGPGFEEENMLDDGKSHLGIRNVRDRLNRISGGELIIDSRLGKGTDAVIILPKDLDHDKTIIESETPVTVSPENDS